LGRQFLLSIETERPLPHTQEPDTGSYPEPHQSNLHTVLLSADVILNITETELNVSAHTEQKRRRHDAHNNCLLPHQTHTNRAVLTQ
jgi:hypothetical protein